MLDDMMLHLIKERPVGTDHNTDILFYLENKLKEMGYAIIKLPFSCTTWQTGRSCFVSGNREVVVFASPFSQAFDGTGKTVFVQSMEELEAADCTDRIVIIGGELAESPLQPKDYPFYYPDEHRRFIELLENKQPSAIIAATGKDELCGLCPFPLFEDGNFPIPSAYMPKALFEELQSKDNSKTARLTIRSKNEKRNSYQLVAQKKHERARGKIVVCAHMDTKYHTPGALDNGAGLAVLLEAASMLANSDCEINVVPFNGEEYYEASGEIEYLKYIQSDPKDISLVVNIDSPCHMSSQLAVSFYNFSKAAKESVDRFMQAREGVFYGAEWYAGDHAVFAFRGIPCMVLTSSDIFNGGLNRTHTMQDTLDTLDLRQVRIAARYIHDFITEIQTEETQNANCK